MNILEKNPGCFIFIASLLLLFSLQLASLNPNEQDRFFYFSLEMMRRGPSFFPYVKGAPYPDYIALVMIMSDAISRLIGHVSVFSVGFPYCITGALLITFTYLLGATNNKRLGMMSAFFCLLSWKFLDSVSALDLDLYPALSTVICVYLAHKTAILQKNPPFFVFLLLWLFGYFCRGPIGLFIPALMTGLYYFTNKQWKVSVKIIILFLCAFFATSLLLLFMAYKTAGKEFMYEVLGQQGFNRVINEHAARYYFFFTIGLLSYACTSIFAIMVGAKYITSLFKMHFRDHNQKLFIFSLQWSIVIILFFTLPSTKKARYILPLIPAISILSAYAWIHEESQAIKHYILYILKNLPFISIIIAIICFFLHKETASSILFFISLISATGLFLFKKSRFYEMGIFIIALMQMIALHITIIEPITSHSMNRISMVPWF